MLSTNQPYFGGTMRFTVSDVEKICGVKRHRLFSWVSSGYIQPSLLISTGSGIPNVFSVGDLVCILFFRKAVEAGLSRKTAKRYMYALQSTFNRGQMKDVEAWRHVDEPAYLVYHILDGEVIGSTYVNPLLPNAKDDVFERLYSEFYSEAADFSISINLTKILKEVFEKIEALNK